MHPLSGVVEKLRNADEHLRRLYAETRSYIDEGSNAAIVPEQNANDSGRGIFRFKVLRHPPLKLSAIAGDVVHNLRSSLDYIIDELVRLNGKTPTFQNLYPICTDSAAFNQALAKGRLYGVSTKGVWAIEQFQPYHVSPEAQVRHPLIHLHKLSNRDKHHMLALSALNASFVWKFVGPDGSVLRSDQTIENICDGGVLAEVPIDFLINGTKAQFQSEITITVGFAEPATPGFDMLGCLQTIREHIGKYLVPAFATFFGKLPDELVLRNHGLDFLERNTER